MTKERIAQITTRFAAVIGPLQKQLDAILLDDTVEPMDRFDALAALIDAQADRSLQACAIELMLLRLAGARVKTAPQIDVPAVKVA